MSNNQEQNENLQCSEEKIPIIKISDEYLDQFLSELKKVLEDNK